MIEFNPDTQTEAAALGSLLGAGLVYAGYVIHGSAAAPVVTLVAIVLLADLLGAFSAGGDHEE